MTEAAHLHLDQEQLTNSSRRNAIRAVGELSALISEPWPSAKTEAMVVRVLNLDAKLVETAVFVRRAIDLQFSKPKATTHSKSDPSSPFVVNFNNDKRIADLKLVLHKIIHHKLMHAQDPGSAKIETINCECDQDQFTQFNIAAFCAAIQTTLNERA